MKPLTLKITPLLFGLFLVGLSFGSFANVAQAYWSCAGGYETQSYSCVTDSIYWPGGYYGGGWCGYGAGYYGAGMYYCYGTCYQQVWNPNINCTWIPDCTTAYSSASCATYAGQYGIPSNYTVGTAYYYYNSCTNAVTYTGGCSAPPAIYGSCSSSRYSCSSGDLGATAEYPNSQAPTTYAYQWWCNGSNGGSNSLCTEWKPVINGSCSSSHYNCSAGTRGDYFEYPDQWQWWCNGSNGGSNIMCAETKSCTQLNGPTYYCANYAGQYGIPSNYTVGTVNYTYNSCTNAITLVGTYGGCTAPAVPTASLTINGSHNLTLQVDTPYTWNWSSTNGTSWSSSYTSNAARCGSGTWVANNSDDSNSGTITSALAGCQFTVNYTVSGLGGTVTDTAYATIPAFPVPSITSFTASPTGFSAGGGNVTLSWTTMNATSCTITGGGLNLTKDPRSITSYTIPNRVMSTATYTLACSGPGGATSR